MVRRKISILGSTGSIGTNTLDIVRRFPDLFEVVALAAGGNDELMAEQVREFKPSLVSMKDEEAIGRLKVSLGDEAPALTCGDSGSLEVARHSDANCVVSAFVGAVGLLPTLEALKLGRRVALANKETLVMAGALMTRVAAESGAQLLPVDSEHSAIFQCLEGHRKEDLDRILLTASGGPFLDLPLEKQRSVTVRQALDHPVWKMGPKVSIDSSTMMNKGLEAVEARWLFDVSPEQIEVLIHPSSSVHSMVGYIDGSIIAQVGASDMRGPIAYALSYPERLDLPFHRFDPSQSKNWEFRRPDPDQFPCVFLAFEAMAAGDGYPTVLNAANEVAVEMFLVKKIPYTGIAQVNSRVLKCAVSEAMGARAENLDDILALDTAGRQMAHEIIAKTFSD